MLIGIVVVVVLGGVLLVYAPEVETLITNHLEHWLDNIM